ncbi:MAG: CheR family methyltransferase [Lachnospira sp.]
MHVIFLRNVMICYDETTKEKLVQRLYEFLEPGGYLIIGEEIYQREYRRERSAACFMSDRIRIFRKKNKNIGRKYKDDEKNKVLIVGTP